MIGASSLLDRLVEDSGTPGWLAAWERAELLDLEQTDGDVTITLVRAYADRNQVLVGFTVAGLPAARTPAPKTGPRSNGPPDSSIPLADRPRHGRRVRHGSEADAGDGLGQHPHVGGRRHAGGGDLGADLHLRRLWRRRVDPG